MRIDFEDCRLTPAQQAALPRGAALETAWDVCEAARLAILSEPRRYLQTAWVISGARLSQSTRATARPACGTICCRAGWLAVEAAFAVLPDKVEELIAAQSALSWAIGIGDVAGLVLGAEDFRAPDGLDDEVQNLFEADALERETHGEDWEDEDCVMPEEGTAEYARLGAAGLEAFMRRHEGWLRTRRLADVPWLRERLIDLTRAREDEK